MMITELKIFESSKDTLQWLSAFRNKLKQLGVDPSSLVKELESKADGLADAILYKDYVDVDGFNLSKNISPSVKLLDDKSITDMCDKWLSDMEK